MPQFTANVQVNLDGVGGTSAPVTVSDDAVTKVVETVLAAQPGALTTRTSDTAGTLTMTNADHGIVTGQRIDIYWDGGVCYVATAGTVAGTSIPFTGAAGDVLPADETAVKVGIPKQTVLAVAGDNTSAVVLSGQSVSGNALFLVLAGATVELNQDVVGGTPYYWYTGSGITNPIAGDAITSVWMSHNDTSGARALSAAFLFH